MISFAKNNQQYLNMLLFYNLSIRIYVFLIRIVSFFNPKAKQWIVGRKNLFSKLQQTIAKDNNIVWFHAASLGEFEQGRPVIEAYKEKYPDTKILLTFFSPSGYEVRKNYEGADYIFYLPPDFPSYAKRFISIVNPKAVYFIKYEFWYHYLNVIRKKEIPCYIFSTIFRPNQLFFKSYGKFYRRMLKAFTHFFVQNQESKQLLKSIGFNNVDVVGDTRFDRVYTIAHNAKKLPELENFSNNRPVLIAGSTWPKDEENIIKYINTSPNNYKYIIAAHEVDENHINNITRQIKKSWVRYTKATPTEITSAEVLVIDCIGILSSLYRYGDISYIGGGFGRGIHNTLEAATFGLPIIFGPNYHKFQEAKDLLQLKAAITYNTYSELENILNRFFSDTDAKKGAGEKSKKYVEQMRGASEKILNLN